MLQYVIAGLVLGGIYAIASAGLVITYVSSGILNFSFGALAYFVARFYYYLHTQQNWGIPYAALLSILVAGPALGVLLYFMLFRFLRLSSPLVKVVATLGLLVAIPALSTLIFGTEAISSAPGLAPQPVRVFDFIGVAVTLDQVIVYACVVATVVVGSAVLRYTDVGLKVRALVDSPAMTALSGTSPSAVSIGVWAVSTFFVRRLHHHGQKPLPWRYWLKWVVVVDLHRQCVLAQMARRGPWKDCASLPAVVQTASQQTRIGLVLADAEFDSERNHTYNRQRLRAQSVIPAKRGKKTWRVRGVRAEMRRAVPRRLFRHRALIESVFSSVKRKLSARAPGRLLPMQQRQALLLGLSFNLYRLRHRYLFLRMSTEPNGF